MRILVVDDEFQALRQARELLGGRGHETYIASDSRSALGVAQRHSPDAIILDVALAAESGLEAIGSLRATSPSSAIVVMTALASADMMYLAYASGADGFVPKSDLESLPDVLDDLMNERRQRTES